MMADEQNPKEGCETHKTEHIRLKVAAQDGSVVICKIKKHVRFGKLFNAYCKHHGLSVKELKFRFDGEPIKPRDTPELLEMQDGHRIDVFQVQTGGAN